MKKMIALLMIVFTLCGIAQPMYISAETTNDPCGSGCSLLAETEVDGTESGQVIVVEFYECGIYAKEYKYNVCIADMPYICTTVCAVEADGEMSSSQMSMLVNSELEEELEEEGYEYEKTGGYYVHAPNLECDLYVKPWDGQEEMYETLAWDIIVGKGALALVTGLGAELLAEFGVVGAAEKLPWLIEGLDLFDLMLNDQHRLICQQYDAIDMCRGYVKGMFIEETIYKKETYRVYYTDYGNRIEEQVGSTIGQYCYNKGADFMTACIGRYYNDYHVLPDGASGECSMLCDECGGAEHKVAHDFADATCTSPQTCTRCGGTKGEALGHAYGNHYFFDATYHIRTCIRENCEVTHYEKHIMNNGNCMICKWDGETFFDQIILLGLLEE